MNIATIMKSDCLPAIFNDPEKFLREMEIELSPEEADRFEDTVNAVVYDLFVEEIFDDEGGYVFGGGGGGSSSSSSSSSSRAAAAGAFAGTVASSVVDGAASEAGSRLASFF